MSGIFRAIVKESEASIFSRKDQDLALTAHSPTRRTYHLEANADTFRNQ